MTTYQNPYEGDRELPSVLAGLLDARQGTYTLVSPRLSYWHDSEGLSDDAHPYLVDLYGNLPNFSGWRGKGFMSFEKAVQYDVDRGDYFTTMVNAKRRCREEALKFSRVQFQGFVTDTAPRVVQARGGDVTHYVPKKSAPFTRVVLDLDSGANSALTMMNGDGILPSAVIYNSEVLQLDNYRHPGTPDGNIQVHFNLAEPVSQYGEGHSFNTLKELVRAMSSRYGADMNYAFSTYPTGTGYNPFYPRYYSLLAGPSVCYEMQSLADEFGVGESREHVFTSEYVDRVNEGVTQECSDADWIRELGGDSRNLQFEGDMYRELWDYKCKNQNADYAELVQHGESVMNQFNERFEMPLRRCEMMSWVRSKAKRVTRFFDPKKSGKIQDKKLHALLASLGGIQKSVREKENALAIHETVAPLFAQGMSKRQVAELTPWSPSTCLRHNRDSIQDELLDCKKRYRDKLDELQEYIQTLRDGVEA